MTEEVRQALRICPPGLRQAIDRLPDAGAMEELRLRCGQPPACRIAGKEHALPLAPVTPELLRGIVEKGSVAIDGVSLTVAAVTDQDFSVSIIPHTGGQTTLLHRRPGEQVNLETDIIGKYVSRLLAPERAPKGGITREFLTQYGF